MLKELRPVMPILVGASIMLSIGMGVRQSFGLVMQPLTRDIALTVSDFALAMSVQNLAWGFLQPVAGALAVRLGFRPVMVAGSLLYVAGLFLFAIADGMAGVLLGGGVLIGMALACTASAIALGAIALFNVFGSLFFGWAGGRWPKLALLGGIYIARSIVLAWYFLLPPTPLTTLLFASLMGFLWLGVGPLVAGSVAEMFGLRWQAMIQGVAFMSHQIGSFLGAFGGGLLFDALGSYDLAWRLGVAMGLTAGVVQVAFALLGPPPAALRPIRA